MHYSRGFTLMEIMVTVAIIGIIAAIAFPAYNGHMVKTRRTAAAACLTEAAQFMERFYTSNMRYDEDSAGAETDLPNSNCRNDLSDFYAIALADKDVQTFTLSATPETDFPDAECGVLTIDQAGVRTADGSSEAEIIRTCW